MSKLFFQFLIDITKIYVIFLLDCYSFFNFFYAHILFRLHDDLRRITAISDRVGCKKELARRVYAQQIDESSKSVFEAIEETLKTDFQEVVSLTN